MRNPAAECGLAKRFSRACSQALAITIPASIFKELEALCPRKTSPSTSARECGRVPVAVGVERKIITLCLGQTKPNPQPLEEK